MYRTPERTEQRVREFWSRVDKRGPDECWPWMSTADGHGYGSFSFYGIITKAHRLAWAFAFGEPGTLHVLHRCDNPPCCNPAHLFLGTHQDNMTDAKAKKRHATKANGRWNSYQRPGEGNPMHKLTESIVLEIRSLYADGDITMRELAERFYLSIGAVFKILRGTMWSHVGGELSAPQRVSADQVADIRRIYAQGEMSMAEVGRLFGISAASVHKIVRHLTHCK